MASLTLQELEVRYGDVPAVRQVSLHVAEGEFVTLLGPSGCGKTTVLRAIAGLEPCTSGGIEIGEEPLEGPKIHVPPENRGVNMVFQTYAVWPHMTVYENVAFGLKVRRVSKEDIHTRVKDTLQLVGLLPLSDRYATELSGGQQQRVALARALVTEPRVILFDEPLSNLDASLREQMRSELRDLHDRIGKTALYVTHDQAEAMVMSDRVVLMNEGRIEQQGTPRELYERPATRFAAEFLGMSNLWPAMAAEVGTSPAHSVVELNEPDVAPRRVSISPPGGSLSEGSRGLVAVRPEQVDVLAPEAADQPGNTWSGVIENIEYLGGRILSRIRLSDGRCVRAETKPAHELVAGKDVTVAIDPATIVWIPEGNTENGNTEDHTAVWVADATA